MLCKFKCKSKTDFDDGYSNVHLEPVREGSAENLLFFKLNPSGIFDVSGINPETASQIEVGKEYFIDIKPVIQESEV